MARGASELGWTPMDLAFLLGTIVTDHWRKAKAVGYALLFAFGIMFALLYGACFWTIRYSSWWLGALFGAVHAVFVCTVVVNVLLPVVHPRIGTPETAANEVALIEAARVSDAELRPQHVSDYPCRAHCLRRDCRLGRPLLGTDPRNENCTIEDTEGTRIVKLQSGIRNEESGIRNVVFSLPRVQLQIPNSEFQIRVPARAGAV
jgi:hypothetical protein